jgi:hypothetical protein
MAIHVDVQAQLDPEQAARLASQIRALVRAAVHAGIQDAMGDLVRASPLQPINPTTPNL